MIICAAIIMILEGAYNFVSPGIAIFVLAGVIFIISGSSQLFKFSDRGYHYRQGTIRLRTIRGDLRDLIYLFHDFKIEEILAFISSYRSQIDEIDLDLYKASMTGDVNIGFDGDVNVNDKNLSFNNNNNNNSELHIVVDSSESPHSSPRITPNKIRHSPVLNKVVSSKSSPVTIRIETNSKDEEEN